MNTPNIYEELHRLSIDEEVPQRARLHLIANRRTIADAGGDLASRVVAAAEELRRGVGTVSDLLNAIAACAKVDAPTTGSTFIIRKDS